MNDPTQVRKRLERKANSTDSAIVVVGKVELLNILEAYENEKRAREIYQRQVEELTLKLDARGLGKRLDLKIPRR